MNNFKKAFGCLLFFFIAVQTSAFAQVTVSVNNMPIKQVIRQIEKSNGYSFFYSDDVFDMDRKITVNIKNESIESALNKVFAGTNIRYAIGKDKQISLTTEKNEKSVAQASKRYSGVVTDSDNGELIIGASIVVKGSQTGTVTDIDGKFSIEAPDGSTLSITYIGYTAQEIKLGENTSLLITMREDLQAIDEVVVIGYGVQRKRDLTGAVSSIKMNDTPVETFSTVSHALAGKAAGLRVTQATAQPGAGATFRIRGETSINAGNEPLIIIDGFPVSKSSAPGSGNRYDAGSQDNVLEMINPADIESIEVLKDASTAAIYGSRAGHGVIIVTTKRGKEGKINVTYSGNTAVQTIAKQYEMLDAPQWMTVNNMYYQEKWRQTYAQGIYAGYVTPPATFKTFDEWMSSQAPAHYYSQQEIANAQTTDWVKEVTRTGIQHSHNLSLTGGNEKSRYLASLNYFDQKGVIKNSDMNRLTLNLNNDYQVSKYIKTGFSLNMSRNKYDNIPLGTLMNEGVGVVGSALLFDPYLPVYDENGKYTESMLYPQIPNPVSLLEITDITTKDRVLGSGYVSIEPITGLTLKATLGFDRRSAKRQQYLPSTTLHGRAANGTAHQSQSDGEDYLFNLTANYMKTIGKHSFTVLAGYEYQKFNNEWFNATVSNFAIDGFLYNNMKNGTQNKGIDSYASRSAMASVFGRANYSFADKYLLTATIRTDGASNFNRDYRWSSFPSLSMGWRFTEESFMMNVKSIISNGKLRLGYGQTGNSNVGNRTLDYFSSSGTYAFGDTGYNGIAVTELGNRTITWETTSEWNVGLDLGFINNRINLSLEYYDRVISNLLVTSKSLPMYNEVTSIAGNIGKTQGQGFEATLNTVNVQQKNFVWTSDLTFYKYTDRWKERASTWIPAAYQSVNDPIRAIFTYKSDGLLKPGEAAPAWQPALLPGQVKIQNLSDEGKANTLDQYDVIMLGTQDPDFTFGFNNTLRWKSFDLNIYLYGEVGRWRDASYYDDIIPYLTKPFSTSKGAGMLNTSKNALNSWTTDNQNTTVPGMLQSSYSRGDYFRREVSYLRCRNITLGYTLPVPKNILNSVRVNLSVNNPFVISNWNGLDPETDYNPNQAENNASYSYPNVRTFSLGLDINF